MVVQDIKEFHKSIGNELIIVKDRVRNLIGDRNWGEDGKHKEAVLREVISRFLPKNYSIGTGFVINREKELTKQIDIIIYDDTSPVLFREGDFVIVLANTVKAIIEVKSKIEDSSKLRKYIETSHANSRKIFSWAEDSPQFFNGIFAYECDVNIETIGESIKNYFFEHNHLDLKKVNNIALGKNNFIHYWSNKQPPELSGYELVDLSFTYFISNLLETLDRNPVPKEHHSLFYPFETKEPYIKFKFIYTNEGVKSV